MQLYDFTFRRVATYNWRVIDCITLPLSHAPIQPRNRSTVTRPFPARGFGSGNETTSQIAAIQTMPTSPPDVMHRPCSLAPMTLLVILTTPTVLPDALCHFPCLLHTSPQAIPGTILTKNLGNFPLYTLVNYNNIIAVMSSAIQISELSMPNAKPSM